MHDTLLIGYDFIPEKDNAVLIIGRKRPDETIDIVNAFAGEEAKDLYQELYQKLIIKKEAKDDNS